MLRGYTDMVGQKFNHLFVLRYEPIVSKQKGRSMFLCLCDCGIGTIVRGGALRDGHSKSCGCWYKDGHSKKRRDFLQSIRDRDGVCQSCGKTPEEEFANRGKKLSVHHKDGDDTNDVPENCITYCNICHTDIEKEILTTKKDAEYFEIMCSV